MSGFYNDYVLIAFTSNDYAHSCGDINTGNIPAISDFSYNTKLAQIVK